MDTAVRRRIGLLATGGGIRQRSMSSADDQGGHSVLISPLWAPYCGLEVSAWMVARTIAEA
jgi:hypothetical protein